MQKYTHYHHGLNIQDYQDIYTKLYLVDTKFENFGGD